MCRCWRCRRAGGSRRCRRRCGHWHLIAETVDVVVYRLIVLVVDVKGAHRETVTCIPACRLALHGSTGSLHAIPPGPHVSLSPLGHIPLQPDMVPGSTGVHVGAYLQVGQAITDAAGQFRLPRPASIQAQVRAHLMIEALLRHVLVASQEEVGIQEVVGRQPIHPDPQLDVAVIAGHSLHPGGGPGRAVVRLWVVVVRARAEDRLRRCHQADGRTGGLLIQKGAIPAIRRWGVVVEA